MIKIWFISKILSKNHGKDTFGKDAKANFKRESMEISNLLTKISSYMIKIRFISKILPKKSKFSVSSYEALVKTSL